MQQDSYDVGKASFYEILFDQITLAPPGHPARCFHEGPHLPQVHRATLVALQWPQVRFATMGNLAFQRSGIAG